MSKERTPSLMNFSIFFDRARKCKSPISLRLFFQLLSGGPGTSPGGVEKRAITLKRRPSKPEKKISQWAHSGITSQQQDVFIKLQTKLLTSRFLGRRAKDFWNHNDGHFSDSDWDFANKLVETGEKVEVELITASSKGFYASFRSLIGFLPVCRQTKEWIEFWVTHRSNRSENIILIDEKKKPEFMSPFIGKKVEVFVPFVSSKWNKVTFSLRQRSSNEYAEKLRNLMDKLQIGDTVQCTVIEFEDDFRVLVEDVETLIHATQYCSWDSFSLGEELVAKVIDLDFQQKRIWLSLMNS